MDHGKELYGFPTSVNLRYFASNFQEKQREAKQKEKELANAAIQKEVLKVKESPWKVFSGNTNVISSAEERNIEEEFVDNYYIDLLKPNYLSTANGISSNFKLFRLLFRFNTPIEDVSQIPALSDKPNIWNNIILLMRTAVHCVKKKIQNLQYRCLSFVHRAIYLCYGWSISHYIQRLVIPLKDTSLLRKMNKSKFPNVYLLKTYSQYDIMLAMLSIFWSDLPKPIVFLNRDMKSCTVLEKVMFTLIDWKNISSEGESSKYNKLRTLLEQVLKKKHDVLFCLQDNHEEEFEMLCQIMKDIVKAGTIPDAFLTIVNFSFEVTLENVVENTLLSNQEYNLDLVDFLSSKNFNSNLGLVRVKFGTPFSVKEVVNSYERNVLHKMKSHLEWELSKSRILMSTGLISFILLYKFRHGVKLTDLIKEVDRFKNDLNYRGKRLGFSGNARNVVNHAIHMLNDKIVMVQINNEYIIKPVLRLPNVLSLSYLSRSVLSYFVLDAAMMTCFAVLFRSKLENIFKGGENLVFNHFELIEKIEQLCEILQFEFNFENPSLPLSSEIFEMMFKYIEQEYFVKNEKLMTAEEEWGHRLARHLDNDDEDDFDYRSNRGDTYTVHFDSNGDLYSKIVFYKKSLQPILESYVVTIGEMKSLIKKNIIHSELIKLIFLKMKSSFENNQSEYPESISLKHACNCVKLMEKWNVLESYTVDEIKVLFLSEKYNNEVSLCDIENKVRSFL